MTKPNEPETPAGDPSQPPRRRAWLVAFLGFFLLIGAWSVAAPFDGTPDEQEHIVRAAGVARGQVAVPPESAIKGGGAFQDVPGSLVRTNCWKHEPKVPASCSPDPGGDEAIVHAATGAGRYHPGYYAIVGGPLALFPDWTGLLLARLISAALCAALLANALTDAMRWSRFRLMAAGVVAAVTPVVAEMGGAVNPNGVELAAGVAFFAAGIPLLFAPGGSRSRTLLWHLGVAALALASLRTAGPLWLAVSAVALLIPVPWRRVRDLWQWRAVRWWTLSVVLVALAGMAWTVIFKTNFAGDIAVRQLSTGQATLVVLERWNNYADELIGVTSWLDTRPPAPAYRIWQFLTAGLILWGFLLANRAGRWRLLALGAGGALLPTLLQIAGMNTYGLITQGRYLLPVLVGLPLLATYLIQEHGLGEEKSRSLLRLSTILLPLHLVFLAITMVRWQRGLASYSGLGRLNPLAAGSWHPPLGSVVPLAASIAGIALIGWLVWFSGSRAPRPPVNPAGEPSDPPGSEEQVRLPAGEEQVRLPAGEERVRVPGQRSSTETPEVAPAR